MSCNSGMEERIGRESGLAKACVWGNAGATCATDGSRSCPHVSRPNRPSRRTAPHPNAPHRTPLRHLRNRRSEVRIPWGACRIARETARCAGSALRLRLVAWPGSGLDGFRQRRTRDRHMEATLWPRGVRGVLSDRRRPTPWRVHRPTGRSSPGDHRAGACSVKHPQRGDDSWRDRYAALARGSASTSSTSCCSR